jgi:hypothetical protein
MPCTTPESPAGRPPRSGSVLPALVLAVGALAAPIASAGPDTPLTYDDARHLLARTGFGPTDAEVRAFTGLTREYAVDRLLAGTRTARRDPAAPELDPLPPLEYPGPNATLEQRQAFNRGAGARRRAAARLVGARDAHARPRRSPSA